MDGACSKHERDEKMHTKFWLGILNGRDHLEDVGVDGRIILEWVLRNRVGRCGLESFDSE
jgi:hypothetical protein